jgi:hypothetical protein
MTKTDAFPADTVLADSLLVDSDERDDRALELRRKGTRLKTIAAELGFPKTMDANVAFNRALRRQPAEDRVAVRAEEQVRLDAMAETVRGNTALSDVDAKRRLGAIDRLRTALMSE